MAKETQLLSDSNASLRTFKWARRAFIPITILAWVVLAGIVLWAASHVIRALLLVIIAALLAYALAPAVKLFERFLPRTIAILLVYLVILGAVALFVFFAIRTTVAQTHDLVRHVQTLLTPNTQGQPSPLERNLLQYGITHDQIQAAEHQLQTSAEQFASNSIPLLRGLLDFLVDIVIVAVLSIYLLIDGSRVMRWARQNLPNEARANFFLDTLQRIVGGYIRGQLTLSTLIGVLVWLGMLILHVPYSVFLGVLAFAMAFIPVLGTLISGAICVLVGLTQGWLIALLVLLYFVIIHLIEGELIGPRIVGHAIGLHPVVSLFAVVAGSELFGIAGALFASPLAGLIQAIVVTIWTEWRQAHPQYFRRQPAHRSDVPQDSQKHPAVTPSQEDPHPPA